MGPLIPVVALAVGGGLAYKRAKAKKGMTPERQKIFQSALKNVTDPVKLENLAKQYDKEGLRAYGDELRKRAKLRAMPPEQQKARDTAFRKALSSTDPAAVQRVARAFHKEGAYGAAKHLNDYAKGLSQKVLGIFHAPRPTPPAPQAPPQHAGEETEE